MGGGSPSQGIVGVNMLPGNHGRRLLPGTLPLDGVGRVTEKAGRACVCCIGKRNADREGEKSSCRDWKGWSFVIRTGGESNKKKKVKRKGTKEKRGKVNKFPNNLSYPATDAFFKKNILHIQLTQTHGGSMLGEGRRDKDDEDTIMK